MTVVACIDCKARVQLGDLTEGLLQHVAGILNKIGAAPLALNEIARCRECAGIWRQRLRDQTEQDIAQAREAIIADAHGEPWAAMKLECLKDSYAGGMVWSYLNDKEGKSDAV